MLAAGAGRVVLASRRSPSAETEQQLRSLSSDGRVQVVSCDVADWDDLRRVWPEVDSPAWPLRGIIHAAGTLQDGVLTSQSWASFEEVLKPKVQGAINLHHLTASSKTLELFVAFSSISGLFGLGGQGNYAAANVYLDALMSARRTMGLPGLSIQWGSVAQVGMAARLSREQKARVQARGIEPMDPDAALSAIPMLVRTQSATVAVAALDFTKFDASAREASTLTAALRPAAKTVRRAVAENHAGARERLTRLHQSQRLGFLVERVQECVASLLGVASEAVDVTQGFHELGLDSLSAVELRSRLQTDFGVRLASTFAFDHSNVEAAANHLARQLLQTNGDDHATLAATEPAEPLSVMAELERLESALGTPV
jgi:acyl carrier protein